MADSIDELAQRSRNFGFLLEHEPLLVVDGASAEAYIYSDPDAAIAKARRFTETLARLLVRRTQTRAQGHTQDARVKALTDAGLVVPKIRQAFDRKPRLQLQADKPVRRVCAPQSRSAFQTVNRRPGEQKTSNSAERQPARRRLS